MNIRWKVSALIAALFAVLGVTEIYVAKHVLVPSFTELERTEADVAMRRIRYALNRSFDQLLQSATSYGNWSDTYRFAHDQNRRFIHENISPAALKQLDVNAIIVMNRSGRFLASAVLDPESARPLDLGLIRRQVLDKSFPWRNDLRDGRTAFGFLQSERGVLMLAASPVLDGFGRGPARGAVMLGKLLSADEITRIGAQAQAPLSMLAPGPAGREHLQVETSDVTLVRDTINDIYGHPIFSLQVDLPREITRRGYSAVYYASAYLIGAAVLAVTLLVTILDRAVLGPLARVTRHAVDIGQNKDLTTRLDFTGSDEIAVLAREFDHMVARVAESRSQLVDQSFQAGFAELSKGVLHNIGNAMTPVGVRLSVLSARLRSLPAQDLELAVNELARGDVDPARRGDLADFARLACGHLVETVEAAKQDLEVMTRQASVVQSALTEQMRSARNEHVIEPVRLPELVSQSLDVVPDSARQCLSIHSDESLHAAGVLHLPRTVLGLVLQNLIINASDAVRECGKTLGNLDIRAEIVPNGDLRQLLLHCTDDGIGIASDDLERIFKNGFSTKSKETNCGIGLHWCANAINALGGRVWATSAGVGHGASFHVMIPLLANNGEAITRAA